MNRLVPSEQQLRDAEMMRRHDTMCVYSEAGTGKTLTAIHAMLPLVDLGLKALVVAPSIALSQWREELEAHDVAVLTARTGAQLKRSLPRSGVVLTSWALAAAAESQLRDWSPHAAVLDEAHALARTTAQRTKAFLGRRFDLVGSLLERTPCIWPMTGTPILAYPDDLWPTLHALAPGALRERGVKHLGQFRERYCVRERRRVAGGRMLDIIVGGRNEAELNDMLYNGRRPLAIRRTLAEVDETLPSRRERRIEVAVAGLEPVPEPLDATEARRLLESPRYSAPRALFGLAKADAAREFLEELQEPTLVLYWHEGVATTLADRRDPSVAVIDGSTRLAERDRLVSLFKGGNLRLLFGQIGAMGVALNLQAACRRVVFVERVGSPAMIEQAIRRVWRRGQRRPVQIDYVVADHALERATDLLLAEKLRTQTDVLTTVEEE